MSAVAAIPADRPQNADLAAWLAVAAGTIGALMAMLDISIVNSALPTIQGEIGATATEGTWVATSYLVAEIIIIPLAGWLDRVFGLRTFLLIATVLFIGFSIMCGLSTNLTMMVIGRVGQGLTGGAMIPTGMMIIATRLPPHQQPIGMALFGSTVVFGPVLGPLVGGWLADEVSWRWAFFLNIPLGIVLIALLAVALPHRRLQLEYVREADWLGIIGMTLGLGTLTALLEEGQREQWFQSPLIWYLAIASVIGFLMLYVGQKTAAKPVIRLALLKDWQFGSVVALTVANGMIFYGTCYAIPQFLAIVAGHSAFQAGLVVLWMGLPSLVLMGLTPLMMRTLDIRLVVGVGMTLIALGCMIDIGLTADSVGSDFVATQLLRGTGLVLTMMFLNQAAVSSVSIEHAGDASGLFNAARNLGGSFALAGIATMQDQRLWFHGRRLEESLAANAVAVQDHLSQLATQYGEGAMRLLSSMIHHQALTMTYIDLFWVMTGLNILVMPLLFLLRPLPKELAVSMH